MKAVLEKLPGIRVSATTSGATTAALAYVVHKSLSPIRFPPTVVLTPLVAQWFGRKNRKFSKNWRTKGKKSLVELARAVVHTAEVGVSSNFKLAR
jgi:CRISPR/Cas system-associated protein Csm6